MANIKLAEANETKIRRPLKSVQFYFRNWNPEVISAMYVCDPNPISR